MKIFVTSIKISTSIRSVFWKHSTLIMIILISGSGRKFEDNAEYVLNTLDGELDSLSRYTVDDVLCLPRQYCDQLRGSKHLLDQYPNMKTVAAFLTEKYFQNIQEEDYSHSQCNVRQCLKDLLN